jgi:beta-xylosidase
MTHQLPRPGVGAHLAGVLLLLTALTGCALDDETSSTATSLTPTETTSTTTGPEEFVNPVIAVNFPDPGFLAADGTFHLYGTEGEGLNVQTMTSTDLITWTPGPDALPQLGAWALPGKTWAPEIISVDGGYVMFYTAADQASGRQCIGRATASAPTGPFVDEDPAPFVCQPELGGSIDPNPVRTPDGSMYLYWKNDGNCCGQPVHIWGQQLDPGAGALIGDPAPLLSNTQPWEGDLVEAPQMVVHDGKFVLFYAANTYNTDRYAQGYADCTGPLGPCTAAAEPLLVTNTAAAGPGHGYIFDHAGQTWILYHAWPPDAVGFVTPGRQVWLDQIEWTAAGPVVNGPSADPQPRPVV